MDEVEYQRIEGKKHIHVKERASPDNRKKQCESIKIINHYGSNKNTNNETIVKISGRWDTTNVSEYGKELEQILENAATAIIFECESLDYISSSGLRVFLLAKRKSAAGAHPSKSTI